MELEEAVDIIRGTEYRYIAVDEDLDIFGYVESPTSSLSIWRADNEDCEYLGQYTGDVFWKKTLREI